MNLEFSIKNINDFENVRKLERYQDKSAIVIIDLNNNITFDKEFKPIDLNGYTVKFRGNGHIINNLSIENKINPDGRRDYVGLFSRVKNLYVSNISFTNARIFGDSMCGLLAGQVDDFFSSDSCNYENIKINCKSHTGSLVGVSNRVNVKNTNVKSTINGIDVIGGIVGLTNKYDEDDVNVDTNIKALGKCVSDKYGYYEKGTIKVLK